MTDIKIVTACVLIIGNEVLSGRTPDANLNYLARKLSDLGIRLAEARVIPDVESVVVEAVDTSDSLLSTPITIGGTTIGLGLLNGGGSANTGVRRVTVTVRRSGTVIATAQGIRTASWK